MGVSKTYAAIRADTRLTPAEQEAKIQRLRDQSAEHQRKLRAELRAELRALSDADPNSVASQRLAARKAAKVARREARRLRKIEQQRAKRAAAKENAEREAREAVQISTADPRLAARPVRMDTPEEIAARAARNAARVARERVDLLRVKPPQGPEEHATAAVLATVRRLGQQREAVRGRLAEIKSDLGVGRIGAGEAGAERERLEQLERDLTARLALAREAAGLPREIRAELGATDSMAQSAQRTAARAARRARHAERLTGNSNCNSSNNEKGA
jgi:hypothetical protein